VAVVQDMRFASPRAREVWHALARAGTDVVVFGRDLPAYVTDGVPGVTLDDDDPLVDEWAFLVVWSDGTAAGFAGADVEPGRFSRGAADLDRDFDLVESTDPDVVRVALAELALP
jgi:DICT domain-containing protein